MDATRLMSTFQHHAENSVILTAECGFNSGGIQWLGVYDIGEGRALTILMRLYGSMFSLDVMTGKSNFSKTYSIN